MPRWNSKTREYEAEIVTDPPGPIVERVARETAVAREERFRAALLNELADIAEAIRSRGAP